MAELTDQGYIRLSAEEFKRFIKGQEKNNVYLSSFYSEIESIKSYSIHAKGLLIEEELVFQSEDSTEYDITISDSVFKEQVIFNGGDYNQIWFTDSEFKEEIKINRGNFNKWFWLTGCNLSKDVKVYSGNFKSFHYSGNSLNSKLFIKGGFFDQVNLNATDSSSGIEIDSLFVLINHLTVSVKGFQNIEIRKCIINILIIKGISNGNNLCLIEDIQVYSLLFEKYINLGNVFLSNISINKFLTRHIDEKVERIFDLPINFDQYEEEDIKRNIKRYNLSKVSDYVNNYFILSSKFLKKNEKIFLDYFFYKEGNVYENLFIKVDKSEFRVIDSVFGKAVIKNIDFSQFQMIIIDSSDLSNILLINSFFPTKKGAITSHKNLHRNLYHLYNDLYSVSSKQNNLKDKIEYYKASQENLLLYSKSEKGSFKKLSSILSICVSKCYSDFGQDWIRSFSITVFIIGPLFFGMLLWSTKSLTVDFSLRGFNYFLSSLLKYYPQFLNPTHKLSYFNELFGLGNWTSLIDIISRIFIGIGIFETIRSFRKYVRK